MLRFVEGCYATLDAGWAGLVSAMPGLDAHAAWGADDGEAYAYRLSLEVVQRLLKEERARYLAFAGAGAGWWNGARSARSVYGCGLAALLLGLLRGEGRGGGATQGATAQESAPPKRRRWWRAWGRGGGHAG